MSILFNNNELEMDFSQAEEVLSFLQQNRQTVLCKLTFKNTARMYLPQCFVRLSNIQANDTLYLTQETIKTVSTDYTHTCKVQRAGRNNLYINFPKTLILAYKERPTHCRLTYNPTHNLWEYRLVKKEIS